MESMSGENRSVVSDQTDAERIICHVCYGLHAAGLFIWITPLIGIVMNYLKRNGKNDILNTHHGWMISTFWITLVVGVFILFLLLIPFLGVVVGLVMGVVLLVFYIYRIARGWLALLQNRPI